MLKVALKKMNKRVSLYRPYSALVHTKTLNLSHLSRTHTHIHNSLSRFAKQFGVAKMEAKAFVGEDLVCEAELTLYMGN